MSNFLEKSFLGSFVKLLRNLFVCVRVRGRKNVSEREGGREEGGERIVHY